MKNGKPILITAIELFVVLILTNPSVKQFKVYVGSDSYKGLRRYKNFFIFSIYENVNENKKMFAAIGSNGCVSFNDKCAAGIEPIAANIKEHVDNSLMLVTALNTKIGYYKAAEIAQKAHKEGTTLKDMAVKLGYVKPEEFDQWVVPGNMVGDLKQ